MWRGTRGGLVSRGLALGVGVGVMLLVAPQSTAAHDGRPAHLEIVETDDGGVAIRLSEPVSPWVTAHLEPWLSSRWLDTVPTAVERGSDVEVRHWRIDPPREPLPGQTLRIDGFDPAFNEAVLVRVIFADGTALTTFLTGRQSSLRIVRDTSPTASRLQYLWLGAQHIALGPDHFLFVLALMLLVGDRWRLVGTITAFTLAHSVTLAAAALEVVRLPVDAVEAVIALSLVFLAVELVHAERGRRGLMARVPWAVALAFGLLHGFGFASTLLEVGLPPGDVPMALLAFNVGVEVGQIAFVLLVLPVLATWRDLVTHPPDWARFGPAYAIGALAMYWVIERVLVVL